MCSESVGGNLGDKSQMKHSSASVLIHKMDEIPGNLIYVVIDDQAAFDLIDLPEGGKDKAQLRHKVLNYDQKMIVFQYFPPQPQPENKV